MWWSLESGELTRVYIEKTTTENIFRRTLHLHTSVFEYLTLNLSDGLTNPAHFGDRVPISPAKKITVTLKLAGGKCSTFQCGQLLNISEYSVVKCRRQVVDALLQFHMHNTISWPHHSQLASVAEDFEKIGNTPFGGIVGAMDGSHIPIGAPQVARSITYYNRKKYYSVVLQAICLPDCQFTDVFVGLFHSYII